MRARSAARTGLRQAISRSPGKSGEVISARSCSIEQGQLERAVVGHQLADGRGAQRGDPPVGVRLLCPVFQLVQRGDPGAGDHPAVADHDHLGQPELRAHHVRDLGERGGVAGVAGEDPDRDRAAGRVGEQPVPDLQFPFLAVPGVAAGGQRAAPALQPRAGQVEQRHLRRVGLRGRGGGGPARPRWRPAGAPASPSRRRCHRWTPRPRRGRRPGWHRPPGQGGQLGGRGDDPGDDQRQGQVPGPARRAQQRGQAQFPGRRVHGGDVPVRRRGGDRDRLPGRDQPLALQGGLDRGHRLGRKRRQVRERLVPDLGAVPVGAPHQDRLIHSLLSGLRRIRPPVTGYMHRPATCRHNPHHNV